MTDQGQARMPVVAKLPLVSARPPVSFEELQGALAQSRLTLGQRTLDEIVPEVMPVLEALASLPPRLETSDLDSFGYREGFALITLLGRRLALLDLTPTATLAICATAVRLVPHSEEFANAAAAACIEGFVRGREERIEQLHRATAQASVAPVRVSPEAFLLMPSGLEDPEIISQKVDELARKLFKHEAKFALVDFSQMGEPSADRAAALFGADEMTKMLGASCIFTGLDAGWEAAAKEAGIDVTILRTAPDLAEGLALAKSAPRRGARRSWWGALYKRLIRGD